MSKTVQELAQELHSSFETRTGSGEEKWFLKEGSPKWMTAAIMDGTGDTTLDTAYEFAAELSSIIADCDDDDEFEDRINEIEPDVYNADLLRWLSSSLYHAQYVNDAVQDYGLGTKEFDLYDVIGWGQKAHKEEVGHALLSFLRELVDQLDAEDTESENTALATVERWQAIYSHNSISHETRPRANNDYWWMFDDNTYSRE